MRAIRHSLLIGLVALSAHLSAQKLYIAENGGQHIQRSDGDGTNLEIINTAGQVGSIGDIVIDDVRNRVFWVEQDGSFTYVKRANLTPNGGAIQLTNVADHVRVAVSNQFEALAIHKGNRELYITTTGTGGEIYRVDLDDPFTITVLPAPTVSSLFASYGIDIDEVNDKMYFVNQATNRQVQSANTNGSSLGVVGPLGGPPAISDGSFGTIRDVVVDPSGGKLYVSTVIAGIGQIIQANLNGFSPTPIVTGLPNTITGLALDTKNGFIYWATGSTAVGRAKLDGTGSVNIITGLNTTNYIAFDFSTTVPPKLYWTEGDIQEIHRMNTDGSEFERYYFGGFSPYPTGMAIDQKARMIFWTDGTHNNIKRGLIGETDFDNPEEILDYPDASPGMQGLDIDPDNTMVYFADVDNSRIQRANYSNPLPLTGSDIVTIANPYGVELDLVNGKIYYTANDLAAINTGTLYRANLDGTGQETLISQSIAASQRFMHDVKVDPLNGIVYWVFTEPDGIATIYKADISNVSGTVTPLVDPTGGEVRGIEIDPQTNKIWWVCRGNSGASIPPGIMQADLDDGSNISTLHEITFLPPNANFIALDRGCVQPIAGAIDLTAPLGQTVTADILSEAYFNSSDVITITITQSPTKGTAALQSDNTIDFTPNNGTVGSDLITYQICNDCGLCDQASINITIPNEPPVINQPAPITAVAGTSITIPLSSLLSDPNNNLDIASLSIVSPPISGAVASFNTSNSLVVDYSGITFTGTDNVTIQVCDLLGVCTNSIISITVTSTPPTTPPLSIIIYNGVSPNGDLFNPYFKIENIEVVNPGNSVTIFNRWGDKVFEMDNYDNNDPAKRFNGESNKSKDLPSGVYFYKIEFKDGSPDLTGYLTLKR